ncbi:MAG TPA: response regulator, partial [Flavobacteriales bacterium]|nr:response regulator [Flavobacteriales bacterium]
MKILVIEDEVELAEVIVRSLEREHFVVETARDKSEALRRVTDHDYDLVLLDIMLPGGSGLEVLRAMKEAGKAGNVIIISAKDSLDDKLAGLDLGADDYLTKPFHIAELNARVRSVLRRKDLGGRTTLDAA